MAVIPSVFIVDDEPLVRKALKQSLESLDAHVVCFPTPQLCLEALKEECCDLVITDVNMPELNGIELLEQVRSIAPLVPVVVVTGFASIPLAVQAVQMGAADFIEKPLDEEVLLPKVRKILAASVQPGNAQLSPAEEKVLRLIVDGRANKEIAHIVGRSIRTVENHRHRLMKKLRCSSAAELVKVALKRGI
jgi:FixJ family two-component response regulator